MLKRGASSWLCMKFEFAFFAGHDIFDQVLPSSFPNGIFMLFMGRSETSLSEFMLLGA
jgi:hypothetical protein